MHRFLLSSRPLAHWHHTTTSKLFRKPYRAVSSRNFTHHIESRLGESCSTKQFGSDPLSATLPDDDRITNPSEENLFISYRYGGGWFPNAAPGRFLEDYLLVRKLRWDTTCSVWLALDKSAAPPVYVAIKILTTYMTSRLVYGHSDEDKVLQKIVLADRTHPGCQHCLHYYKRILAGSWAGPHICFVTQPLSLDLENLRPPGETKFAVPTVKRIIKQLLLALDFLHSECGFIHTDVNSRNIMLRLPDPIDSHIEKYIESNEVVIRGPFLEHETLPLPIAFCATQPLPYFEMGGSLDDLSICLADYGEATPIEKPNMDIMFQVDVLRAPEVILRHPWSSSLDIWGVGCLVFELVTGHDLFKQEGAYSRDIHLTHMVELFGPFPASCLKLCGETQIAQYFDDSGELLSTKEGVRPASLENNIRDLQAVDEDDVLGVAGFIRRCLVLDPALRPSAKELLKDDWLRGRGRKKRKDL